MTRHLGLTLLCLIVTTATLAGARAGAPEDALSAARDLYAAAAYEDALGMLNRLPTSNLTSDERRAIDQYRAFCLLALGRASEAERAIEAVVAAAPAYHPLDGEVSPRVRSAFSDVRKRMLPAIVQRQYGDAKAAYDQKQYAAASDGFARVVALLGDPDLAPVASQPPLADLRTLADGFRDLAVRAAAPPPPPPPPPPAPAPAPAPVPPPAPAPLSIPAAPRVYASGDANVVPPLALRQVVPDYPGQPVPRGQGVIEILIDETGVVESAAIRTPVTVIYDKLLLAAAKTWRYKSATVNGQPVKFRKEIVVAFKAPGS